MSDTLYALLVLNPQDEQEIVYVSKSGGYYDETRILWDERKDGPLPQEAKDAPSAVIVSDDTLLIDEEKQAVVASEKQAEEVQAQETQTELDRCFQYAQAIDAAKTLDEVKSAVKYILMTSGVI